MFQTAALQSVLELVQHMPRQCPLTRRQVFYERRVVGFDPLLQEWLLGPVTRLFVRTRSPSTGVLACQ